MEDIIDADALLLLQKFNRQSDGHWLILHVETVENVELAQVRIFVLHEERLLVFCLWVLERDLGTRSGPI